MPPPGFRVSTPIEGRIHLVDAITDKVMDSAYPGVRENTSVSDAQAGIAEVMQKAAPKITDQTDIRTVIVVGYAVAGE
jgi:glutamyl-tRNA reductase